ncbi:hypothetical protein TUM17576_40370 [Enterobacter hormaechei]|nr:hypothetical protein TUM17576_40370 [Enterobacter hormaechei]
MPALQANPTSRCNPAIPTELLHLILSYPRCHYASVDNLLDPTTGDYTGTSTSSLANAVYLRLMVPLGSWWAQPDVGSKLHLLRREKDVTRVLTLARQYAEEALAPLTADTDGRAKSISVETFQAQTGWLLLLITVIQADGITATLQHTVRVV